ncbi:MAG: hypothetical protein FD162_1254 [Rhodobacteraceae bacterium]|nr:MAG: hypothetical protein FD162_1254 [Paracoccaceae bacterium]
MEERTEVLDTALALLFHDDIVAGDAAIAGQGNFGRSLVSHLSHGVWVNRPTVPLEGH